MRMRTTAVRAGAIVLCSVLSACQKAPEPAAGTAETAGGKPAATQPIIGWLHGNCLAVDAGQLSDGAPLYVATLGEAPSVVSATIDHRLREGDTCYALLQDRRQQNESAGRSFYIVSMAESLEMAIGVVAAAPATLTNGQLDVDGDGNPERFVQCSTSEGINFSVWTSEPYRGTPLWSGYYYLGYDVEANCPEPSSP